jgi:hypothetical protein
MIKLIVLLTCFYSIPAYAYIDPGTNLFLLQGLLAILGGLIAFIKNPIEKIKYFFSNWFGPK